MARRIFKLQQKSLTSRGYQRDVSEELGEDLSIVKCHKRTGRPLRKSAGKRELPTDYVKTEDAVVMGESSEEEGSVEGAGGEEIRTFRRRPRSPRPPPLSPVPADDLPCPSSPEIERTSHSQELAMTVHVPPGHEGPLVIKLDLSAFVARSPTVSNTAMARRALHATIEPAAKKLRLTAKDRTGSVKNLNLGKVPVGFLNLPPELRNIIYRLVFVAKDPFDFHRPINFCRSAAFLRTCRQIHHEGRQILYSENSFSFEKQNHVRANYWNLNWYEVGWKDVRLFLESVGPTNISLIRDLSIMFEDASPSSSQHTDHEQRRFVHDPHLIQCLKMLAEHSHLKTLSLSFHGRKRLVATDYRFLKHLKRIQADEVKMVKHAYYPSIHYRYPSNMVSNVSPEINTLLLKTMGRKEKLYKS